MLLNCGVGEDSWESLDCKEIKPVNGKGNQSWIILEGLMLKLKLQYFGHLMWRTDSLEKTLMLGKIKGRRRRRWQRMRWLDGITDLMDMNLSTSRELVVDKVPLHDEIHGLERVRHDWATEKNWWFVFSVTPWPISIMVTIDVSQEKTNLQILWWWFSR